MAPMRIAPQGSRASRAARGEIRDPRTASATSTAFYISQRLYVSSLIRIRSPPHLRTHLPPSRYAATVGCPVAPHTVSTLYKEIPCTYT